MLENISYYFFKRRLRKKMGELYAMEDPWGGVYLSEVFAPLIRRQMQTLPEEILNAPVLDAGGGEGHYYSRLSDLVSEYHLLDINQTALSRAYHHLASGEHKLIRMSLDEYKPLPDFFGCIWLISILNYLGGLRHPRRVLEILNRLWQGLKPGGLIFLIHPYYHESELGRLEEYSRHLEERGAILKYRETRVLGKQTFLIEIFQKVK